MTGNALIQQRILATTALALSLALVGCGEEDPLGNGGGGGTDPTITVRMGSLTTTVPPTFQNAVLGMGVVTTALAPLSSGGSTSLSIAFVDQDGNLYDSESVAVTFSSTCIANGRALIGTNPLTSQTGVASTTYTANGCGGIGGAAVSDVITATATANGQVLTATGTIFVAPSTLGSIAFVSANPNNIGLQGTGGTGRSETSTVTFEVRDSAGAVLSGQGVVFALNTSVGGITCTPCGAAATPVTTDVDATTDANGRVQVIVQAGTVATSVRVTASASQTTPALQVQTQSDQLTITTGVPDQDSMSLSADKLNPEGLNFDGELATLTIRMADRFNNPVPDNTAVTFTTEGGSIVGQCVTDDGACTVTWTSQNPRPGDGRLTVLATAIGEESFNDVDGDGVFDNAADTFTDLPEAFRDDDEDLGRDPTEQFLDFDVDGSFDAADGLWNGLLCQHATLCGTATSVSVRASLILTMSGSTPDVAAYPAVCGTVIGGAGTYTFNVRDENGNPMPSGTTVSFDVDDGNTQGPTSYTVGSTNAFGGTFHSITIVPDATLGPGLLTVTVTTPRNVTTICTYSLTNV